MTANPRKETLAERAKRFVGDALEHEEGRDASAESSAEPTIARSSHTRRREQVLQAQRAHRQRTQGYIKALENEILRLRARENALLRDTALIRDHVSVLEQTLLTNGIGIPRVQGLSNLETPFDVSSGVASGTPFDMSSVAGSIPSSVPSSTGIDDQFSNVTIDLRDMQNIEAERWCSTNAAEHEPRSFEVPSFDPVMWENFVQQEGGTSAAGAHFGPLDAQTGINFILELERPCLPHVKYRYLQEMPPAARGVVPDYNAGPGHVFTATEQIVNLQRSPSPSLATSAPQPQTREQRQEHSQGRFQRPPQMSPQEQFRPMQDVQEAFNQPFNMPKEQIDKLLETSSQLELHTEVTPVQIWARLSGISSQFPIGRGLLQALKDEFLNYY
ncbi:hypothetical protein NA57DRAFT_62417 [Rhizodiscina lignyota]|uniref:BZIP domain-containing protein n=1 Tax=Rhizodiscina lignyota TaxID=1504668 RepID=A0A9P4I4H0_9PEZI|nr:hypothetical protein NA57DRAFT_62417 [Rhizodiscina lignyota]